MAKSNPHKEVISVSKSYHDAVENYLGSFSKLTLVSFIANAITFILVLSLNATVLGALVKSDKYTEFFTFSNRYIILATGIWLVITLIQILGIIALTYMVVNSKKSTVMQAFENSFIYFLRYIGQGIAILIATTTGLLIGYVLVTILGILAGNLSIDLNTTTIEWLNLIPFLISAVFSTFFLFSGFSIIDKNNSVSAALKHSFKLVRGHFWPTVLRILLMYLVIGIIAIAFSFIPAVGGALTLILITPFMLVYLFTLYQNLNKINS